MVTAEDISAGKPDPEGYLLAARRLGVAPAGCLVFEDAEPGILAGKAAGADVLVIGAAVHDYTGLSAHIMADGALILRGPQ